MTEQTVSLNNGDTRQRVSNAVVSAFKDFIGKGPTRARTYISDNLVVCLMEDTRTRAESSLIENGEVASVMATRKKFQDTMHDHLVREIGAITQRKVIAFMSDSHLEPDFASETFVLAPYSLESPGHESSPAQEPQHPVSPAAGATEPGA